MRAKLPGRESRKSSSPAQSEQNAGGSSVEKELLAEFQRSRTSISTTELRRELSKRVERCREKSELLSRLRETLQPSIGDAGDTCDFEAQIVKLEEEFREKEAATEFEDRHMEVLLALQMRVKSGLMILRQRTRYLEFALRKVSRQHSAALDTLQSAETAQSMQVVRLSRTRRSLSDSISSMRLRIQQKATQKERLTIATQQSLTRISQFTLMGAKVRRKRQSTLDKLKQDCSLLVSAKQGNRLRAELVEGWIEKMKVVRRLLAPDTAFNTECLDSQSISAIVNGYFRLISTELALKARYESLCTDSEERALECQQLWKELEVLEVSYSQSGGRPQRQREELNALLQVETERARKTSTVDTIDGQLMTIYWKFANLAKKIIAVLEVVRKKGGIVNQDLVASVASLSDFLKNSSETMAKRRFEDERRPSSLQPSSARGFPVSSSRLKFALKSLPNSCEGEIDMLTSFYKEAQILNYFTDLEMFSLGKNSPSEAIYILVEKAYKNFRSRLCSLIEGQSQLFGGIYGSLLELGKGVQMLCEGAEEVQAMREDVLLSPENRNEKKYSFDGNASSLQCFSSTVDSIRRLKGCEALTFDKPSTSSPDSDEIESSYLQEARRSLKSAYKGPPVQHHFRTSLRKIRFSRFLARESYPEHEVMRSFYRTLKESATKLSRVKSQAFPLTAVSSAVASPTRHAQRDSVSATVSPTSSKSFNRVLR